MIEFTAFSQHDISQISISSACECLEACESINITEPASFSEVAQFPPVEGVLNFYEDPLNEWPWPDTFEQTKLNSSIEENISFTHHRPNQLKCDKARNVENIKTGQHQEPHEIRTIIIDSRPNLNVPHGLPSAGISVQQHTENHSMDDERNTVVNFVADLYNVAKVYLC